MAPCYPDVNSDEALSLRIAYRTVRDALDVEVAADTSPERVHVATRRAWQQHLAQALFDS